MAEISHHYFLWQDHDLVVVKFCDLFRTSTTEKMLISVSVNGRKWQCFRANSDLFMLPSFCFTRRTLCHERGVKEALHVSCVWFFCVYVGEA